MKIKPLIILIMLPYFLIGCDDDPKEIVKTVDFYKQNKEYLDQKIKECKNNPGELMKTPDCINALKAYNENTAGELTSGDWGMTYKN